MWKSGRACYHGGYVVEFRSRDIMPNLGLLSDLEINKEKKTITAFLGYVHECDHILLFVVSAFMGDKELAFERGVYHIVSIKSLPSEGEKIIWQNEEPT